MNAGAVRASTSSRPQSHFELFGLPVAFGLDQEALERAYREIQAQVHPDRFAHAGDAERRASLQWTTRVNEAYRTLKDPVQRGRHLLELHGVDVAFETNTQMPTDFLMRQLELREELEAATGKKDPSRLDRLRADLSFSRKQLEKEIAAAIDTKKDYGGAAELVRKLMFLDRLDGEIDVAYEEIE
ncbi:MAG TPA: Fe-S protein assembly co-chaperone HscB [Burkholderiales bacterium]